MNSEIHQVSVNGVKEVTRTFSVQFYEQNGQNQFFTLLLIVTCPREEWLQEAWHAVKVPLGHRVRTTNPPGSPGPTLIDGQSWQPYRCACLVAFLFLTVYISKPSPHNKQLRRVRNSMQDKRLTRFLLTLQSGICSGGMWTLGCG